MLVSLYVEVGPLGRRDLAVKYVNECEGRVQEGWKVFSEVLEQV